MSRVGWMAIATAIALLLSAGAARAQQQEPPDEGGGDQEAPAPAQESPAQGADAADGEGETTDPELQEARERIRRGEKLFENGDYEAALAEFERANELLQGHRVQPLVLFNIGKCHEKLFRYDRAMKFYRRYLERAGPDAQDREQVKAKIELLEGLLGTVELAVNVDQYEVWVDDNKVGQNKTQILVPGGSHTVEVRSEGHVTQRKQIQVAARSTKKVRFELTERAEEFRGFSPAYFWASTGAAIAAAAIGTGFGVKALRKHNDIKDAKGAQNGRELDPALRADIKDRDDLALKADVFFGIAGAFAVGSLVLGFLTDWSSVEVEKGAEDGGDDESKDDEQAEARLRLSPVMGRDSAGLRLRGEF